MAPQGLNVPGVPSMGRRRGLSVPGAAAAAMPSGATGIWYADTYVIPTASAQSGYVPNSASGAPAFSGNLLRFPRGKFGTTGQWEQSGLTVSDNSVVGPDGLTQATAISHTAGSNWFLYPTGGNAGTIKLPAGTWNGSLNVRWTGTGSASFRLGSYSTQLTTFTAADQLWHRYKATFTSDGTTALWPALFSPDGTSACALEICDFNLFPGSVDFGPVATETHMLPHLANTNGSPIPAWAVSGGAIELGGSSGGGYLTTPLPGPNFSIVMTTKKTGTTSNNWLVTDVFSLSNFSASILNSTGQTGGTFGGVVLPSNATPGSMGDRTNVNGFHTTSYTYDGATLKRYSNGALMESTTASLTISQVNAFVLGLANGGNPAGYSWHALGIWPTALTAAQVAAAHNAIKTRAATKGLTVNENKAIVFIGDSITVGQGDTGGNGTSGYADRAVVAMTTALDGVRWAISGTTYSGYPYTANVDAIVPANKGGRKYVAHIFITNDINTISGSAMNTLIDSFIAARRATGFDYILVGTLPSRQGVSNWDTNRAIVNSHIRSLVGSTIDAVVDYGSTSNAWGADGAFANATYSADGVHPTPLVHGNYATVLAAALDAIS